MTTIPTALLIIAGASVCLLLIALAIIWTVSPDKDYPAERYGKIGMNNLERAILIGVVWLAPTAAAVAGWMVFG